MHGGFTLLSFGLTNFLLNFRIVLLGRRVSYYFVSTPTLLVHVLLFLYLIFLSSHVLCHCPRGKPVPIPKKKVSSLCRLKASNTSLARDLLPFTIKLGKMRKDATYMIKFLFGVQSLV